VEYPGVSIKQTKFMNRKLVIGVCVLILATVLLLINQKQTSLTTSMKEFVVFQKTMSFGNAARAGGGAIGSGHSTITLYNNGRLVDDNAVAGEGEKNEKTVSATVVDKVIEMIKESGASFETCPPDNVTDVSGSYTIATTDSNGQTIAFPGCREKLDPIAEYLSKQ
jgi:hypothetical protein